MASVGASNPCPGANHHPSCIDLNSHAFGTPVKQSAWTRLRQRVTGAGSNRQELNLGTREFNRKRNVFLQDISVAPIGVRVYFKDLNRVHHIKHIGDVRNRRFCQLDGFPTRTTVICQCPIPQAVYRAKKAKSSSANFGDWSDQLFLLQLDSHFIGSLDRDDVLLFFHLCLAEPAVQPEMVNS